MKHWKWRLTETDAKLEIADLSMGDMGQKSTALLDVKNFLRSLFPHCQMVIQEAALQVQNRCNSALPGDTPHVPYLLQSQNGEPKLLHATR